MPNPGRIKEFVFANIKVSAKGFIVGAANVIPGVSGGTMALITGIFEKLIHSIRSIDGNAFKMLLSGRLKEFSSHINFFFLVAFFTGVVISIFTLARLLDYLFQYYPVFIWAYFFGLILASVYHVGRTIPRWKIDTMVFLIAGASVAYYISHASPAAENENFLYLVLSGAVAVCSMILPGLSGSFILIVMGNYQLIAIEAINHLRLDILFPVFIGIVAGLLAFSRILSWLFKRYRGRTLAILTGFIAGSLPLLWPWKTPVYKTDITGNTIAAKDGTPLIEGYERFIPGSLTPEVITTVIIMVAGIASILLFEFAAGYGKPNKQKEDY